MLRPASVVKSVAAKKTESKTNVKKMKYLVVPKSVCGVNTCDIYEDEF